MCPEHHHPSLGLGLARMKPARKPAKSVQREQLLQRQQMMFGISKAGEPIVKPDRAIEQRPGPDIEPDPPQPIGYRHMLDARRRDDGRSEHAQSIEAEGVRRIGSDRFGGAGDDRRIDQRAPDDMEGAIGRGLDLNQNEDPIASDRAATHRPQPRLIRPSRKEEIVPRRRIRSRDCDVAIPRPNLPDQVLTDADNSTPEWLDG